MKRFIKYPSIEQFRTIIKNVQHNAQYQGNDENGEPIYDRGAKMPVIIAEATEKIHGTNASVCYSNPDGFWVQSRTQIITPESDNAGCAFVAEQNKNAWMTIIKDLAKEYKVDLDKNIVSIYFEWCGGNIQKNAAVSGLDKMAIIFKHFKVSPIEPSEDEPSVWYETCRTQYVHSNEGEKAWIEAKLFGIYNIHNFPTYSFTIDFNNPLMIQNEMIRVVEEIIEPNSPVGKKFGIENNIGEGIVVSFMYKDVLHSFKVKGEKHSNSKVKTLKPVDNEKLQKVQDVATLVTPAWRLEQMFDLANDTINGGVPDIKNMGTFMKLLNSDIIKEESDVIADNGLEPKEIFGTCSKIARVWYNDRLDGMVGL